MTRLIPILALSLALACPSLLGADLRKQPYLGLSIRDTPDGPVVGWIFPGPLGGQSFTSTSGIRRGDNLVSVNGQAVDAPGFNAAIATMKPGDAVTLVLRRSPQAQPNAAVPIGGPGGDEFTVTAVIAPRHEWMGTVGRGAPDRDIPDPPEGAFEAMILARAQEHGVLEAEGGLNALMANLHAVQEAGMDPNALDAVINVFRRPLSIDAQEGIIDVIVQTVQNIAREDDLRSCLGLIYPATDFIQLDLIYQRPRTRSQRVDPADARALVRHLRDHISVGGPDAARQIRVIADATDTLETLLPAAWTRFLERCNHVSDRRDDAPYGVETPLDRGTLPQRLAEAVTGDVLEFWTVGDRFGVRTGPGPNRVNMAVVAEVIDMGGDDHYLWPEDLHQHPHADHGNHIIIDLGGDDLYESLAECAGPGAGVFGFSIIDDRAGDDIYRSARPGSIGFGLFGIGVLIDHDGNDRYENLGPDSGWSTGVGFYGVGLVIDHAGDDVYHAEKLSQGVGGPRGFGAIIDGGGNDRYLANGPNFGSAYGTPDVFLGMSQGFGFGVRSYAAGGVGAIYDDAGNDEYIAGEFSQAGGYYFGLGILHDRAGNDRYHGNRYGQAFAAHQAAGILIDDAGDDSYWSMTAASQSGVWDQSITMLIDRAGNDTYRAEGLALGAASMQAIGVFLDLGGDDRYEAAAGSTLGQSGSNSYHYEADRVFSFSAFFDLGGGDDTYPAHRANNRAHTTGTRNENSPKDSGLFGIFVDE